jgi:WD40 repeat protein
LAGLFEHLHQGQLSCALFADSRTLITAGVDCTISVWSVISTSKTVDLQPKGCLFGHNTPVTTLAISRSLSAFLSASSEGEVFLWDLNRLEFVRKLCAGRPVSCARINDVSGNIMICRGRKVALYNLNGQLILEKDVCDGEDDQIVSCAFYEGTGDEWLERELLLTGHKRGVVNIWSKVVQAGAFTLDLVKRLDHLDRKGDDGASITCILPMAQKVYTGDEDGKVVSLPRCLDRYVGG